MTNDIFTVILSRQARKDLCSIPINIAVKLQIWIEHVNSDGLYEIRKIRGYHDEPLEGKRFGQQSIRLNRSYRAFYKISKKNRIEFVDVIEVNKHDY
jgi:proteic killer suppression protein